MTNCFESSCPPMASFQVRHTATARDPLIRRPRKVPEPGNWISECARQARASFARHPGEAGLTTVQLGL
jgi:hypothetical protein